MPVYGPVRRALKVLLMVLTTSMPLLERSARNMSALTGSTQVRSNEVSRLPGTWMVFSQNTFACVRPSTWVDPGCPRAGVRVKAAIVLFRHDSVIGLRGCVRAASARLDEVVSASALTEPHNTARIFEFLDMNALPIAA